jgi:hypothetical protein
MKAYISPRTVRLGWNASRAGVICGVLLLFPAHSRLVGAAMVLVGVVPTVFGICVLFNVESAAEYVPYRGLRDDWPLYFRRSLGFALGLLGLTILVIGFTLLGG